MVQLVLDGCHRPVAERVRVRLPQVLESKDPPPVTSSKPTYPHLLILTRVWKCDRRMRVWEERRGVDERVRGVSDHSGILAILVARGSHQACHVWVGV